MFFLVAFDSELVPSENSIGFPFIVRLAAAAVTGVADDGDDGVDDEADGDDGAGAEGAAGVTVITAADEVTVVGV